VARAKLIKFKTGKRVDLENHDDRSHAASLVCGSRSKYGRYWRELDLVYMEHVFWVLWRSDHSSSPLLVGTWCYTLPYKNSIYLFFFFFLSTIAVANRPHRRASTSKPCNLWWGSPLQHVGTVDRCCATSRSQPVLPHSHPISFPDPCVMSWH
jgi:hypothetical protein